MTSLPVVSAGVDPALAALWALPRKEAEEFYAEAFRREDRQALRWLGCCDRYFLMTCVLRREDVRHDWIYDRCREVEADPNDRIDLWARDHYKSSIITFAGIIQELLKDPELTVCIFSHIKPAAEDFLRQIRREFEENDFLKHLYPEVCWQNPSKEAPRWSDQGGIVLRRKGNPKEATVEASGLLEGMATGKHFGLRVYDDVVTERTVTTPDMIRKVTERFDLSEYLGTRDGLVWIIGTRYHFADTYGVLIQRGVFRERRHAATHDGTFDGKPVFLTEKQWERKKTQPKSTVAAQMLLNPLAGSEARFDIRWLQFWEVRPQRLNVYILVDPSKGKHVTSDDTAIAVIGVDVNRNKYLLDGWRHRMSLSQRWHMVRDTWKRWSKMPGVETVMVGYEQFGMQTDDEYFQERMLIENISFPLEELAWPRHGPKSKEQRIERLEPDWRMGRFRLPAVIKIDEEGNVSPVDATKSKAAQTAIANGFPWQVARPIVKKDRDDRVYDVIARFLEEYVFFPFAPRNDFLDACSRIYDIEPQPPVYYEGRPGHPLSTEPEFYPDT